MKKRLLISCILISSTNFAQLTQTNEPAINDLQLMYVCDTLADAQESNTGPSVTWDYSDILGLNNETQTIEVLDPATTANASDFPSSSKAFSNQNSFTNYFNSTATERVSQGFVYQEPTLGTVLAVFNTDEQKTMNYPFAFGNSCSDVFAGTISFEFNGIPQNPSCTGNSNAWIDGQGTLLLPNATSIPNVIRYKIIDTVFTQIVLIGPMDIEFIRIQYEYYSTTTNPLPLFTHTTFNVQQPGSTTPLLSQSIVLSAIQPQENLSINEVSQPEVLVYPNPSSGQFNFSGLDEKNSIKIYDQSGRMIKEMKNISKMIDLSELLQGLYTIQIQSNGHFVTQKIAIRN